MIRPTLSSLCRAVPSALLTFLLFLTLAGKSVAELPEGFPVADGLSVYLDADALDLDGDYVTRWIDRSGNGNHAVDSVPPPPERPVVASSVTPSGQDAIRFDGIGGYAEIAGNPADFDGRAKTTFVVFRADTLASGTTAGRITNTAYAIIDDWALPDEQPSGRTHTNVMWAQEGAPAHASLRVQNRNPEGGAVTVSTPENTVQAGEFYVGVNQWRENGDTVAIVRNAANERFQNHTIGAMGFPEGHLHTRIGSGTGVGNTDPAYFFGGEIAAFLVYNRELTAGELQQVEEYLHEIYLGGGPGEGGAGDPPVTAGLVAHLNATNTVIEGGELVRLNDLSGRGNHAAVLVEAKAVPSVPTLLAGATPSGLDAIHFNGLGGYMEIASNPDSFDGREKTILTVFRSHTLGLPGRFIVSGYAEGAGFPYYMTETMFATTTGSGTLRVSLRQADGITHFSSPNSSVKVDEFYIGAVQVRDNGEALAIVRNQDNNRFVNQIEGIDAEPMQHEFTRLGTGGPSGVRSEVQPDSFFTGELAAVLIYNRALPEAELQQVEQYLHTTYLGAGPGSEGPGDPPVVDGLVLHLNASAVDLAGSKVTRMVDQSGAGNDAHGFLYQAPRPSPTFIAGATPSGKGALRFDEGIEYLEIAANPAGFDGAGRTSFVVFSPASFGLQRMLTSAYATMDSTVSGAPASTTAHSLFTHTSGALRVQNRDAANGSFAVSSPGGSVEIGRFHVGINHWAENGDVSSIVLNDESERFIAGTTGAVANPGDHLRTIIGAGAQAEPADFYLGDIAAVVMFNRELSEGELAQVEDFLYSYYLLAPSGAAGYDAWIAGFDVPEGQEGQEANPSGDGVPNLAKYVFGLHPLEASRDGLPFASVELDGDDEFLTITVQKNPDATDFEPVVEVSQDLGNWASEGVHILEDTPEVLRARSTTPISASPRQFLRVNLVPVEE